MGIIFGPHSIFPAIVLRVPHLGGHVLGGLTPRHTGVVLVPPPIFLMPTVGRMRQFFGLRITRLPYHIRRSNFTLFLRLYTWMPISPFHLSRLVRSQRQTFSCGLRFSPLASTYFRSYHPLAFPIANNKHAIGRQHVHFNFLQLISSSIPGSALPALQRARPSGLNCYLFSILLCTILGRHRGISRAD